MEIGDRWHPAGVLIGSLISHSGRRLKSPLLIRSVCAACCYQSHWMRGAITIVCFDVCTGGQETLSSLERARIRPVVTSVPGDKGFLASISQLKIKECNKLLCR